MEPEFYSHAADAYGHSHGYDEELSPYDRWDTINEWYEDDDYVADSEDYDAPLYVTDDEILDYYRPYEGQDDLGVYLDDDSEQNLGDDELFADYYANPDWIEDEEPAYVGPYDQYRAELEEIEQISDPAVRLARQDEIRAEIALAQQHEAFLQHVHDARDTTIGSLLRVTQDPDIARQLGEKLSRMDALAVYAVARDPEQLDNLRLMAEALAARKAREQSRTSAPLSDSSLNAGYRPYRSGEDESYLMEIAMDAGLTESEARRAAREKLTRSY